MRQQRLVDQRSHHSFSIERISDLQRLVCGQQFFAHFVGDRSCAMTRRVEVQRCPAVPTAPKKIDCVAMLMSALGATINALLPPSSRIVRPSRPLTALATLNPMLVEPVADTNGIRAIRQSIFGRPSCGRP